MLKKHEQSISCLMDATEALLSAMEKHGMDPEALSKTPEFVVLVHFLKAIIDGKMEIPNHLSDRIAELADTLEIDKIAGSTLH
jgi:hypothetical protein